MQINLSTYITHLSSILIEKKGLELAYLLSPREEHGKSILKEFRNPTVSSKQLVCSRYSKPTYCASHNLYHSTSGVSSPHGTKLLSNMSWWSTI